MAGLFDFNPQTFAQDPNAGLLARLGGIVNAYPTSGGGASMPPTAQPTAGLVPPMAAQGQAGPAPQGPSPGFLDNLQNWIGAHQNTLASLGAGIASGGLSRGLQQAVPGMQADRNLQLQMSALEGTYRSLVASGVPPAQAQAMALNPELLKTMAPEYLNKPTFGVIGQNAMGVNQYGWIDTNKQTVTQPTIQGATGPGGGLGGSIDPKLTGQDALDAYRQQYGEGEANKVAGIIAGKLPYPSGPIQRTPYGRLLSDVVSQVDPTMNAQTYQQRQKAFDDFYGGGKDQTGVGALRQASDHAVSLIGSLDRLGNYPGGALVNAPLNEIGKATGLNNEYGPAQLNVHALADELSAIWKQGTNSDHEIRAWESSFPTNGTPAQQRAAIGKVAELYQGGVDKLERKREDSFGPVANQLPPIIDPKTEQAIAALKTWASGGNAPTATQPTQPAAQALPDAARSQLREGVHTTFGNGQVWTLANGQPQRVR